MTKYDEIIYWLALVRESRLKLTVLKPIIQRWCISNQRPLSELFELYPLEWATTFGLSDADIERVTAIPQKLEMQATLLAQWRAEGIEPLIYTDSRYPRRLIQTLPPVKQPLILWVQGAIDLLNEPSLVILSEDTTDESTDFLTELAHTMATEGISLVNGYGRGFDRNIFEVVTQVPDGQAIVLLPMGINAFHQTTSKLAWAKNSERIVLVSPFSPETSFQEKFSEARNLLIDYLASVLLVWQANSNLQARAEAAIDQGVSVFVQKNNDLSNQQLFERGAFALTDIAELVELVQQTVIDETMLASNVVIKPPVIIENMSNKDYALSMEEVELLNNEEALHLLSSGGDIPEALRQRLSNPYG
jgi:predicted Rossmann fold nucleotide-binding protein DprA/Smf involved in DNA uptake